MSAALIPVKQFNAMPCLGVSQYVAKSGEVEIVPAFVCRYFGPAATGINAWLGNYTDPLDPTHWTAYTKVLDCRGCTAFTFLLAEKMFEGPEMASAGHDVTMPCELYMQADAEADGGVRVPPLHTTGVENSSFAWCANFTLTQAYAVWPYPLPWNPANPPLYRAASVSCKVGAVSVGASLQTGTIGFVRFWVRCSWGVGGLHTNALMYGSVWAQS